MEFTRTLLVRHFWKLMLKMLHKLKLSSLWKIGVTLTGATFLITFLVWISLATTYQVESHELGHISKVQALNLSHNQLTGSIPKTLSNSIDLESLDLSYNSLRREIPAQLIELTFLEVFSVAYNNLSGRTPCMKQFGTFDASSYEGNLFLCGLPLEKNCTRRDDLSPAPMQSSNVSDEKGTK